MCYNYTCNIVSFPRQSISPQCKPHYYHHSAEKPRAHPVGKESKTTELLLDKKKILLNITVSIMCIIESIKIVIIIINVMKINYLL